MTTEQEIYEKAVHRLREGARLPQDSRGKDSPLPKAVQAGRYFRLKLD